MTNREIIALQPWLDEVSHLPGLRFAEALIKIAPVINKYIDVIVAKTKEREDYKTYSEELKQLNDKFFKRNEKGDVVREIVNGKSVAKFEKGYKKELIALNKKHKDALKFRDKQVKDFRSILDKKADIKIELIKREDLSEQISAKELAAISVIVEK
jgi:hypothetical protein